MHIANMTIPLRFGIDLGEILSFPLFILHFITTLFVVKYFNMVNVEFRTFLSSNELLMCRLNLFHISLCLTASEFFIYFSSQINQILSPISLFFVDLTMLEVESTNLKSMLTLCSANAGIWLLSVEPMQALDTFL